jgi:hypothetical protein
MPRKRLTTMIGGGFSGGPPVVGRSSGCPGAGALHAPRPPATVPRGDAAPGRPPPVCRRPPPSPLTLERPTTTADLPDAARPERRLGALDELRRQVAQLRRPGRGRRPDDEHPAGESDRLAVRGELRTDDVLPRGPHARRTEPLAPAGRRASSRARPRARRPLDPREVGSSPSATVQSSGAGGTSGGGVAATATTARGSRSDRRAFALMPPPRPDAASIRSHRRRRVGRRCASGEGHVRVDRRGDDDLVEPSHRRDPMRDASRRVR